MNTIPKLAHPGAVIRRRDDPHTQLANEQSSTHAARVAVARWRSGDTHSELLAAEAMSPSAQSRWHAATQRDFCAWLDAGGFTQVDTADAAPSAAHPELNCLHCE